MCYIAVFTEVNAMWAILLSAVLIGAPEQAPAQPLVSVSGKVSTPQDPVTCRTFRVTGSLFARTKECRTAREWRRVETAAKATASRMVIEGRGMIVGY
jgi:hypothetical protein